MQTCFSGCNLGICLGGSCLPTLQQLCNKDPTHVKCQEGGECVDESTTMTPPTNAPFAEPVADCTGTPDSSACHRGCTLGVCISSLCLTGLLPACLPEATFLMCGPGGACAPTEEPTEPTVDEVTDPRSTFLPTEPATRVCASHEWKCQNNACIRSTLRCDDHLDCSDGSDEVQCAAATANPFASISTQDNTASSEKSALAVVGTLVVLLIIAIGVYMVKQNNESGPMGSPVRTLPRGHSGVELKTMTESSHNA